MDKIDSAADLAEFMSKYGNAVRCSDGSERAELLQWCDANGFTVGKEAKRCITDTDLYQAALFVRNEVTVISCAYGEGIGATVPFDGIRHILGDTGEVGDPPASDEFSSMLLALIGV